MHSLAFEACSLDIFDSFARPAGDAPKAWATAPTTHSLPGPGIPLLGCGVLLIILTGQHEQTRGVKPEHSRRRFWSDTHGPFRPSLRSGNWSRREVRVLCRQKSILLIYARGRSHRHDSRARTTAQLQIPIRTTASTEEQNIPTHTIERSGSDGIRNTSRSKLAAELVC